MNKTMQYVPEPEDKSGFTEQFDRFYTRFAGLYDSAVKLLPFWKRWLRATLPHIQGPRVLEVSFGTGYLMMQYAADYEVFGIDYKQRFVDRLNDTLAQDRLSTVCQILFASPMN
jgi:ubiquinone/menaquinone biosynthesis C-methylase UbiE